MLAKFISHKKKDKNTEHPSKACPARAQTPPKKKKKSQPMLPSLKELDEEKIDGRRSESLESSSLDSTKSIDDSSENFSDDDDDDASSDSEEEEDSYKPGGYHPVQIGEVYNARFTVLEKLGWGHFSTVWKCYDAKLNQVVAMKVQKSARHYTEAAVDEIELLECVNEAAKKDGGYEPKVVRLIDSFEHTGPNGKRKPNISKNRISKHFRLDPYACFFL